jgi:hypothetical protein
MPSSHIHTWYVKIYMDYKWDKIFNPNLLQRRCWRGLIELGFPFTKHLMNLLFEDSHINRAAFFPSKLQIQEHPLKIINTVLCLVLEKLMRC